jgi:hypothetical protein
MISANLNMNMNGNQGTSITSMSQILNVASKVDMVELTSQDPALLPRIPGVGKNYVLQIAPDFDDALEIGT